MSAGKPTTATATAIIERDAEETARRLGVRNWGAFKAVLDQLERHNNSMFRHSLRVGVMGAKVAPVANSNAKLTFLGGCCHDVGKCAVSNTVLDASVFGDEERSQIVAHPVEGFLMLKDKHPFSAMIAGLHHTFQHGPYGISIEEGVQPWMTKQHMEMILRAAETVAIVDFYDAFTTRSDPKSPPEVLEALTSSFDTKRNGPTMTVLYVESCREVSYRV